ncbi:MAG TPA: efflux RND transporter periplasmic adaptor subunit [Rhabdochlamydiaceae bacterium]|nr:efflux RND transporter periplasmic adaptor subunit [Rhabdochlamydiaceae bacterium]
MRHSIFIVICISYLLSGCAKKEQPQIPSVPVTVAKAVQCDVPIFLDYVGHMEAFTTVQINSQIEGILKDQYFVEGQTVNKGDLLFLIDPRPYQAALQKAEAALALTLANLKYDEDTVRRYAKLIQEDYVSQLDFEKYMTNVLTDKASVKENLADVENAKLNLEYCYIRAPMNAVTGNVKINVGNLIQNASTNPLVTLNQITPIYASFFIPEKDLPTIQSLQRQGLLTTHLFLNQDYSCPYEGILTLIDNMVDENTGMILLKATLPNEEKTLWPGEFVDVRLKLGEQQDAVLVPSQSVQIGQSGAYVFIVKEDQTVEMRTVHTGQKYENYIAVSDGVKADETVVLDGQINLYHGARVNIKNPPIEIKSHL